MTTMRVQTEIKSVSYSLIHNIAGSMLRYRD